MAIANTEKFLLLCLRNVEMLETGELLRRAVENNLEVKEEEANGGETDMKRTGERGLRVGFL